MRRTPADPGLVARAANLVAERNRLRAQLEQLEAEAAAARREAAEWEERLRRHQAAAPPDLVALARVLALPGRVGRWFRRTVQRQ
jgi:hypothetical protein